MLDGKPEPARSPPRLAAGYGAAALLLGLLGTLTALPGCFVDRQGALEDGDGSVDSGTDAATICMPGFVDLDMVPGCECEILTETCNGEDDDCDRITDEGTDQACGDAATCMAGTQTCSGGILGACVPDVVIELCGNMVDDDCDMEIDELCDCEPVDMIEACGSDVGECVFGSRTCLTTGWSECEGGTPAAIEVCNGDDDDCDGNTDEALVRSCGSDVGECASGMETCMRGSYRMCTARGSEMELCDAAGLDEDCDGMSNEGCACDLGETRPCMCMGTETCDIMGSYGSCVPGTGGTETCNGIDDDCDGTTDEGTGTGCMSCTQVNRGTRSYLFCFTIMLDWDAARAHCMGFGNGYDLVVVNGASENDWLNTQERDLSDNDQDWWYGGTDRAMEGMWVWEPTMMSVGYEDWKGGEPGGGTGKNCMSNENKPNPEWSAHPCTDTFRFVCEDQDS